MELTHTRILVTNYPECYRFYHDLLGFECTWGDETSYYAQFKVGQTLLALFDKEEMLADIGWNDGEIVQSHANEVVLIFRVTSVNQKYEELKTRIRFLTEPHDRPDWGIRVAHFKDPNGTLIEINENI